MATSPLTSDPKMTFTTNGRRTLLVLFLYSSAVLFNLGTSQPDVSGSGADHNKDMLVKPPEEKKRVRPARLAGSADGHPWVGRLEVFHRGKWGTVCDDKWTIQNTEVACRWLGFIGAETWTYDAFYGEGRGEILLDDVNCFGNETNLWKCKHNPIGVSDCKHREDIGMRCNKVTFEEQRIKRRLKRLRSMKLKFRTDSTLQPPSEGVLEVFSRNKWRTICADGWDITDSKVVCGMMGFPDALPVVHDSNPFDPSRKTVHRRKSMQLTGVACTGSESLFGDCHIEDLEHWKDCASGRAVEIKCLRGDFVLDAEEPMRFMKQRMNSIIQDDDDDSDSISAATRNSKQSPGIQNEQPVGSRPLPWVRLRAGGNFGEGRVEVKYRGRWGSVCSKGWNKASASVVCRQLGWGSVNKLVMDGGYGQGVGPIWLNKVACKGDETDILDCPRGPLNASSSCQHEHDAGVICNVPETGIKDKVQVIGGSRLSPNEGRVMVQVDDTWGTICSTGWDLLDAKVLCRQAGMNYARHALQVTAYYGAPKLDILITDVECDGTERMIQECRYRRLPSNETCHRNYRAGVVCTNYLSDLVLDLYRLEESVYLQDFPEYLLQCAAEEGCLSSVESDYGVRRLLRFSSAIMNRGTAVFRPFLSRYDWVWHACHQHYHSMEVFTHYDLLNHKGERVAEGHKASFCLEDVYCDSGATPYFSCDGQQGISPNCVDLYANTIDCQWIDITGVEPDSYLLRIDTNPDFIVAESDYSNNEILCQVYYNGFQIVVGGCQYVADGPY